MESYYYIRNARDDYEFLLKKYSSYAEQSTWDNDFVYYSRNNDKQLQKLFKDYGLSRYLALDNEIDVFLKVLRWSHEILLFENQKEYRGPENATGIITYCRDNKVTVNCRLHAIVLTEALLSLGYHARLVCCMPIDVLPYDNHAVTVVYSEKLKKWIALDSARNCCFCNKEGNLLSIMDIRSCLINNEIVHFQYQHRFSRIKMDRKLKQFDDDWYLDYLYKNFFRFYCSQYNGTTGNMPQIFYHLVPRGYSEIDVEKTYYYEGDLRRVIRNTDCATMFWEEQI